MFLRSSSGFLSALQVFFFLIVLVVFSVLGPFNLLVLTRVLHGGAA